MKNLLDDLKLLVVEDGATADTTTINTSNFDCQGYDGYVLVVVLGDVTSGSVLGLQAQGSPGDDTATMANITGASATKTAGASDCDDKIIAVDVHRPTKRWNRGVFTRTTQNAVVRCILAILYKGKKVPGNLLGSVVAQTTVNAP